MTWHRRFFWLLLLFLPTQLGYHFWPQWAMVLGRRVDYLAPTIYLTDILLFATLFFWLLDGLSGIKNYELRIKGMTKKDAYSFILYSLFFILIVANIYGADNRMVAIYTWLKMGEFFLLGWYIVRTKPSLSRVTFPLSLGILYSSILAIAQFVLQHSIGGPLWWLGERTFDVGTPGIARYDFNFSLFTFSFSLFGLRPYATFPHPNVLGGFLAVVLPLILMSQMKKRVYGAAFAVGAVALLLTFSRSAIVVGGVAIAVAVARLMNYELRIKNKKTIILYSLFFILLFVIIAHTDFRGESVVVRGQLNAAAVKLWRTAPFLGVGLGNFLVRLPEALPTRTIYFLQPVHNIYLLLLSETGIIGAIIFVWLIIKALSVKQERKLFTLRLSLYAFLLLGMVDHYPLTLQQGQLLLTLLVAMSLR